jgi:hypothetical protein
LVGAVEAKPEGYTLSSVADQSKRYMQQPHFAMLEVDKSNIEAEIGRPLTLV